MKKKSNGKTENRSPGDFLKIRLRFAYRKNENFVVCPFVDEETKGSYLLGNGLNRLNGLNGLAHLWQNGTSWPGPD